MAYFCLFKSVPLANGEKILIIVMGFVDTFQYHLLLRQEFNEKVMKKTQLPHIQTKLKTPQGFYVFSTLLRLSCKLHSIQDALMLTSICYTL